MLISAIDNIYDFLYFNELSAAAGSCFVQQRGVRLLFLLFFRGWVVEGGGVAVGEESNTEDEDHLMKILP